MKEIRLKVSELFEVDARSGEDIKDLVAITAYVLKHYAFLPKPIIAPRNEPERRFYRGCGLAGFDVAVYDESNSGKRVFDVGHPRQPQGSRRAHTGLERRDSPRLK